MIVIAHRGNLNGPDSIQENAPWRITDVLAQGYHCEIDVRWYKNHWYLGHDEPEYKVEDEFIMQPNLWVHCKNVEAMTILCQMRINGIGCPMFFWHDTDAYTLTSTGLLWTYPGQKLTPFSICVMPERVKYTKKQLKSALGICTDYPSKYKKL